MPSYLSYSSLSSKGDATLYSPFTNCHRVASVCCSLFIYNLTISSHAYVLTPQLRGPNNQRSHYCRGPPVKSVAIKRAFIWKNQCKYRTWRWLLQLYSESVTDGRRGENKTTGSYPVNRQQPGPPWPPSSSVWKTLWLGSLQPQHHWPETSLTWQLITRQSYTCKCLRSGHMPQFKIS